MKKWVLILGVTCLFIGLVGSGVMLYKRVGIELGTPFKYEQSTSGKEIDRVKITGDNRVDIKIIPSIDDQISATFTGNKEKNKKTDLIVTPQNSTLVIKAIYEEPIDYFWNRLLFRQLNFESNKVVVALPKKLFTSVHLQTENGNLQLNELQGKQIQANTENGNIELNQTDGTLALRTQDGSIHVNNHVFRGKSAAITENGDVEVQSSTQPITTTDIPTAHLLVSSMSGNIEVNGYRGDQLVATTENGNLELENIDATFTARSIDGNVNIHMNGIFRKNNQATTENGNIKIGAPEPTSLQVTLSGSNVHSDFPIALQQLPQIEKQLLQGLIGSKSNNTPSLTAQSQNGNVSFGR